MYDNTATVKVSEDTSITHLDITYKVKYGRVTKRNTMFPLICRSNILHRQKISFLYTYKKTEAILENGSRLARGGKTEKAHRNKSSQGARCSAVDMASEKQHCAQRVK